jgi:HEAT repeat protein
LALVAASDQALPLLNKRIKPAVTPEKQRLERVLADLDGDQFDVREKAAKELDELGELATPTLRQAVKESPSAEVRKRAADLLDRLEGPMQSHDRLRLIRAVEVVEQIGTPEAKAQLEAWAKEAPEARLSQEAKKALAKLQRVKP